MSVLFMTNLRGMLISPENWEKLRVRGFKIDQWFEKAVNDAIAKW
jgi:hypothetical protein